MMPTPALRPVPDNLAATDVRGLTGGGRVADRVTRRYGNVRQRPVSADCVEEVDF
jgi:hypothetical protein